MQENKQIVDVSMMGLENGMPRVYQDVMPRVYQDVMPTITSREYKEPRMVAEVKRIGGVLGESQAGSVYDKNGISPALIAGMSHGNNMPYITEVNEIKEKRLGNIYGATGGNFAGNVYDKDGLAPTINTCGGGGREPMIVQVKQATKQGYIPCKIGGGGGLGISQQYNTQRKSNRSRECESYADNNEHP